MLPIRASLADTIVMAGNLAIEEAAAAAGHKIAIPFNKGRGDAKQEMTDVDSFSNLEPAADHLETGIVELQSLVLRS